MTTALTSAPWATRTATAVPSRSLQDRLELQADEDEQHGVGQVDQHLPEGEAEQSGRGRRQLGGAPADIDPGGHGGQDPGDAELLGRQVGGVAGEHRDHDLDHRVVEPAPQLRDQPAGQEPDGHPAGGRDHEAQPGLPDDEPAADRRGDRDPVGDQGGRVVDQALALEQGDASGGAPPAGGRWRWPPAGRSATRSRPARTPPASPCPSTTAWATTATATVVARTSPTADSEIARASARRSRGDEKNPAQ